MYQDVKFIKGTLYYEEIDGKYYPLRFPMVAGGGRSRTTSTTSTSTNNYGYLYFNQATDFNLFPDTAIPFDAIINNNNITLNADLKTIEVALAGIYKIDFIVKAVSQVASEQQNIFLYVNGSADATTKYSEDYTGSLVNIAGTCLVNLPASSTVQLRTENAITVGDGLGNVVVGLTINKVS